MRTPPTEIAPSAKFSDNVNRSGMTPTGSANDSGVVREPTVKVSAASSAAVRSPSCKTMLAVWASVMSGSTMATLGTPGLAALAAASQVNTSASATPGVQCEPLLRP